MPTADEVSTSVPTTATMPSTTATMPSTAATVPSSTPSMPSATSVSVSLRWNTDDQHSRSDRCDQESIWRFHYFVLVKDPAPVARFGNFEKLSSRNLGLIPALGKWSAGSRFRCHLPVDVVSSPQRSLSFA